MSVSILTLCNPQHDVEYTDALNQLDSKVREANAAPYVYPQDEAFYRDNLAGKTSNILAIQSGNVIGYAALRSMDPWPTYLERMDVSPALCGMMLIALVDPDWQGRGIGKQLNLARLDIAKQLGFRYLFSTVHPDNLPSINNLRKLGFNVIAQKPMFSEQLLRSVLFLDLQV